MSRVNWTTIAVCVLGYLLVNKLTDSKIGVPEAIILALIGVLVWRVRSFFVAVYRAAVKRA